VRKSLVMQLAWKLAVLAAIVGLALAGGPGWLLGALLTLLGVHAQPAGLNPPTAESDPNGSD
jgi:hypothetical protein